MTTNNLFTNTSTTSADDTTISYRTTGRGPDLILLPGALAIAADLDGVAQALGTRFTVHTIERRGRGESGPQGPRYCVARECEDIEAVQRATGARFIAGHSFGGLLALEAMLARVVFDRAAVYEPGVFVDGDRSPVFLPWAEQCRKEVREGCNLAAFITFVRGVNPETTGKAPRFLLRLILPIVIRKQERHKKYALLPAAIAEHEQAAKIGNQPQRYASIETPTLFMAGKEMKTTGAGRAASRLSELLPVTRLRTFPGIDHFGMEKNPSLVAEVIADFLLDDKLGEGFVAGSRDAVAGH